MKIRIGDKVRFLNEVGEGVVSRIKDANSVYVEMSDGFEIPFFLNQLVPVHTELILNKDAENIDLEEEAYLSDCLYFVVEPDHELPDLANEYRVYLFNASSYHLLYTYAIKDEAHFQCIKHGEVGAYQKVLLKQVKLHFFNEYFFHRLDAIFFKNTFYKAQTPVSEVMHITKKILLQSNPIEHVEFKHPVYAFILKDDFSTAEKLHAFIDNEALLEHQKFIREFKNQTKTRKSAKKATEQQVKEVDLHIEELVENPGHLSSIEMLHIQLETVEKEIDLAYLNQLKKIIFIHGVGNGRLKQELIKILKEHPDLTYQDGSYKEYGYGATQVNFK
jgi:hypothetical protein